VSHQDLQAQLDAYLDGELALVEAGEFEAHLARCRDCAHARDERLALRAAIRDAAPAPPAPDTLRERVRLALRARGAEGIGRRRPIPRPWSWLALAASLALVAFGGWQLGVRSADTGSVADEVLQSHLRSLLPGHLTDVRSSDQHTVKPWFNGVLDYSPPVYDFGGLGYPLLGGRVDYVAGRPVAALVYGRRLHLISLMVWPASRASTAPAPSGARQGYHVLHWATPTYSYWAVSDLGIVELRDFTRLVRQADSTADAAWNR
jgi:anti-sigma factor RsiW